jgi:hypothetical protein
MIAVNSHFGSCSTLILVAATLILVAEKVFLREFQLSFWATFYITIGMKDIDSSL